MRAEVFDVVVVFDACLTADASDQATDDADGEQEESDEGGDAQW